MAYASCRRTSHPIAAVLAAAVVLGSMLLPARSFAQSAARGAPGGLVLGLDVAGTSSWDVALGPPYSTELTISSPVGLGFIAAYHVTPWAAPWIEYVASFYGDSDPSALSEYAAGLELRRQFGRLAPVLSGGLGRTSAPTAGGFKFNYVSLGGSVDFFVARKLALRAGVHALTPTGDAESTDASGTRPTVDVRDRRTQVRVGLRWHLGPAN